MPGIDAHNHFWKFDPVRDSWITTGMSVLRKNFLPDDLAPLLREENLEGCVVVQSDQSEEENRFQLQHAALHDFIKGVVGWVDLQHPDLEERLAYYRSFPKMKGFRHILQGEADRALMLRPAFKKGIGLLGKYNFTYDILVFPDQLGYATELVSEFPSQLFVIDHLAKPVIRRGEMQPWKKEMEAIALRENVYCKLSGMVTEADPANWTAAQLKPYIDVIVENFGTNRILYGSDWPVCLLGGSYKEILGIVKEYFAAFSAEEQERFFGGNARLFYQLN